MFSGIGGFALAARWAGFETIGFSEVDPFCNKVLNKNFPHVKNFGNIKNIVSTGQVSLITGGFPCQPFSQAGKKRGVDDERYLWPEFARVIDGSSPDWIVIENVYRLVQVGVETMLADLERNGYKSHVFILPACAANAPHRRDRLWIVAHSNRIRNDMWFGTGEIGSIQKNIDRHVAQVQSKWSQLQPESWSAYTARDWLSFNTATSGRDDGISLRMDKNRIKALGNAIVPQVIYPILQYIKDSYDS